MSGETGGNESDAVVGGRGEIVLGHIVLNGLFIFSSSG